MISKVRANGFLFLSTGIALIAVLSTAGAIIQTGFIPSTSRSQSQSIGDVATQVVSLQSEVTGLRQQMAAISQTISSGQTSTPDMAVLRGEVSVIDKRLSVIEQSVVENPSRALALTLLSRDMENLKASYQNEISRLYDLGKWFLGLMFTMAIGLFTLAISNLLKKPEK